MVNKYSKIEEKLIFFLINTIMWGIFSTIAVVFIYLFINSIGVLNINFFFGEVNPLDVIFGIKPTYDGIWNAILGTLSIVILSLIFSTPIGILGGIYLSEYSKNNLIDNLIKISINLLAGLPSIIFGLFGYIIAVKTFGPCLLVGALSLSIMVLPLILKGTEESFNSLPKTYKFSSYAIGASKWETIRYVLFPMALPNLLSGLTLAMGRCAGDVAVVMFTAASIYSPSIGLFDRIETLPFSLYIFAMESPSPDSLNNAYGIAIILILLISFLFVCVKLFKIKKLSKLTY